MGIWFGVLVGNLGMLFKIYMQQECDEFRWNFGYFVFYVKVIESEVNGIWGVFYSGFMVQKGVFGFFCKCMGEIIKD